MSINTDGISRWKGNCSTKCISTLLTDVILKNVQDNIGYRLDRLHIWKMNVIKANFLKLNPPMRSFYYSGRTLNITKSVHNNKHKLTFYSRSYPDRHSV